MSKDVVVTLVKTDDRVVILIDGKVYNYWYLDSFSDELRQVQIDSLNTYLFEELKNEH